MKKLFSNIYEILNNGEDILLVSIISHSGSTPRSSGARMAVKKDGTVVNTIGGGALEYKATKLAIEALKKKKSYIQEFKLAPNDIADLGMICGGDLEVFFQYIEASDENIALVKEINNQLNKNENSWLVTEISNENKWNMWIQTENTNFLKNKNNTYSVEPLTVAGKVYIFGGGHISQKLVPILNLVNFKCVIIDDKLEFTNPELFPLAEETIQVDFSDYSGKVAINSCDYVVILTRGHKNDYEVLVQALRTNACYIGLVGSRAKIVKTKEKILSNGFLEIDFNRIHAPIGIAIKAETPEEIAISIAGEMIRIRAELKNVQK